MRTESLRMNKNILFPLLPISVAIISIAAFLTLVQTTSVIASNDPQLKIPTQIPASPNSIVEVPIQYVSNGNQISSIVFSIDYDQNQLEFDPTVPFSITFNLPGQFAGSCSSDTSDTDGEIDCFIIDPVAPLAPLPDGSLISVTLRTLNPPTPSTADVAFSENSPPASFGNTEGQSVPGSTVDGSVLIETTEPTDTPEPTETPVPTEPPALDLWVYLPSILRMIATETPAPTETPVPTETPTPIPEPDCSDFIINGGFESREGWEIMNTAYKAGYTQETVHNGLWSMRTGVVIAADNRFSYSSFRQVVTIPANVESALLELWLYPRSGELTLQNELRWMSDSLQFEEMPLASDLQYVIILDANENWIDTLVWQLKNYQGWDYKQFNLMKYEGSTIQLHFGTFNDGSNGYSSMFVDDVSLTVCD